MGKKKGKKEDAGVSIRRLTDDRIRHGGDHGHGKDTGGKTGGPDCLLQLPEGDATGEKRVVSIAVVTGRSIQRFVGGFSPSPANSK